MLLHALRLGLALFCRPPRRALVVWLSLLPLTGRAAVPLVQLSSSLYQTEHCLFIVDTAGLISWPTYSSVYSQSNITNYIDTLTTQFPENYFSIVLLANNLSPNSVPIYTHRLFKATGIYDNGTAGVPDYVRYNLGGGTVITGALAVLDHEIGHAWGVQILNQGGHWLSSSTVECQMADVYSDDGYVTVKQIYGDDVTGFRWKSEDNLQRNETEVFSDQQLYLMGLNPTFPTFYVLNNPVYNADNTMSYTSYTKYDEQSMITSYGARNPDFRQSQKHFKLGFVYIARDVNEVMTVYAPIEQSIDNFCNAEAIDTSRYRFQVPFLVETKYRGSVEARLADLDGNSAPSLTITDTYLSSSDGTASVRYSASDPDGPAPTISLVGTNASYSVQSGTIQVTGLSNGVYFFTVKASDSGGKKAFGHFVVEVQIVAVAPSITTQPTNQTTTAGTNVAFSFASSGTAPLSYQWQRSINGGGTWSALSDTSTYSGTGTAALTISNPTTAMTNGQFRCVVTNSAGSATTTAATLTVNPLVIAPSILSPPQNATVVAGNSVSFSVSASGTAPLSYQWYKNGGSISGGTTSTLTLSNPQASDAGNYSVVVSNRAGSASSSSAALTVNPAPVAPTITGQPQNVTATVGTSVTFSVSASGTAPLSYQWNKNGNAIAGATASTFSVGNAQMSDGATYSVVVTNSVGAATSNGATLTMTAAATAPAFTSQPQSLTVTSGSSAAFTVFVSGTAPLSYQWQKDGSPIAGATSNTFMIASTQLADAGSYNVLVTNTVGSATSVSASLTVNPAPIAPSITTQPLGASVTVGGRIDFLVTATGTAPLAYQWSKNGTALSGANSATLSLSNVTNADAGNYTVLVTNAAGSAVSSTAALQVTAAPVAPAVLTPPRDTGTTVGGSASFSVTASGTAPLTYQWYFEGNAIAGATGSTYSINSANEGMSGHYTVTVVNSVGSAASNAALLTVSTASNTGRLGNLSVRGIAGTDTQTLIVGFVVSGGSGDLPALIRGWGPTLGGQPFNVPGALSDPIARLFHGTTQVAENNDWGGDASVVSVASQVGAYPFSTTSKDAVLLASFAPGSSQTVHILGAGGARGVALAELFDATSVTSASSPRLINLSTRAQVGTGANVLIGGFVITGQTPVTVLIRAIGPSLASFGVSGVLQDPKIELHDAGTVLLSNDNWYEASNAAQIGTLSGQMGLPLPATSKDSAILITLNPGSYTVVTSGVNDTTGVVLLNIDDVTP